MRVLLSFVGGTGHAEPMVPIARVLQDAGHTVAFVGHPRYLPALEARGFLSFEVDGQHAGAPLERRPLLEPNQLDETVSCAGTTPQKSLADELAGPASCTTPGPRPGEP